ncbi:choice-of-anchor L domain-containing protein [Crocinitomicaceae bacterium]|nr:choice-of-anchor L domain-containing protein [Crocinitomicaceae bacterium]
MKVLYFLFAFIVFGNTAFSQMTVNTGGTPMDYALELVGPGITISNVTFTGANVQIGTFDGSTSNVGFDGGVVISAGPVTGLIGVAVDQDAGQPGGSGLADNDLLTVAQSVNPAINSTSDAAFLEFDFVPSSNVASFNFVFSSDEYPNYVNTIFNDVFAFYVSGPGIAGPFASPVGFPGGSQNVAVVPGTATPITISTIHPGLNAAFYINNNGNSFTHNGFTVPIPVELNVQCGETYHFKFAIADCSDSFLNTAVFLEAGSFVSDAVDVTVATVSGDSTIVEGCTDANFIFTRPEGEIADTLIINYTIGGEAVEGLDYNDLIDSVVFVPGQDSVIINLSPIQDGIDEGFESVTITVELVNICGDTIVSSGTIYIGDGPIINIDESDTLLVCANQAVLVGASATGGYAPYTYEWTDTLGNVIEVGDSILTGITENGSIDVYVTATDNCDFSNTDTLTITLNQTLMVDTIYIGPATCEPDGFVSVFVSGETTTPEHGVYYSWESMTGQEGPAASVWTDLASGWYYVSIEDAVCTVEDSAFVDLLNPPIAVLTANPSAGCADLLVSFDYSSSENGDEFSLSFGDGSAVQTSNDLNEIFTNTYNGSNAETFTAQLIVSQGENCEDITTVEITMNICGCTEETALNYNPLATQDDGSCLYPEPIVSAPNVFTPNGDVDDVNEEFFLTTENLSEFRLIIFNRWGNVIFDVTSNDPDNDNPSWDGKTPDGNELEDGVYFYKYEGVGVSIGPGDPGVEIQGQGFLHLVR